MLKVADPLAALHQRHRGPGVPYLDRGGANRMDVAAVWKVEGETDVYRLAGGRSSYEVDCAWCQFGLSEPVSWEITIARR